MSKLTGFINFIFVAALVILTSCSSSSSGGNGNGDGGNVEGLNVDMKNAEALYTYKDGIRSANSRSNGVFTYEVVEEYSKSMTRSGDDAPTNLLAIGQDGDSWTVLDADDPVKVMYSVVDPTGKYVYLALSPWDDGTSGTYIDYATFIAKNNCALLKIRISDNKTTKVAEGLLVTDMTDYYMQTISGDQKPLQFDDNGNLYFVGSEFSVDSDSGYYWIDQTSWNGRAYKVDNETGDVTVLTQDNQWIEYFIALGTGELVYQSYNHNSYGSGLYMWQNGQTIDLDTDNWGVNFFTKDTNNTVIWGGWNSNGIRFAKPLATGGTENALLNTSNFASYSQARRIVVADDGRLYGVFEDWDGANTVLKVFQVLPYERTEKATITLPDSTDWWSWMGKTTIQISKGYLYYVDTATVPNYGTKNIIQMVKLDTGDQTTLIENYNARFEIYNWKLSNDILYFSAQDKQTSTVVKAEIDIQKLHAGSSESEYLTVQTVASASGAVSEIVDIEIVRPKEPNNDTGGVTSVHEFHYNQKNLYSVSIDFTKYMNKESVENNISFIDGASTPVPALKVWIYKTLHLIPDTTGLGDLTTTGLTDNTDYTISVDNSSIVDSYGTGLTGTKSATFTTNTSAP